ncbi:MAG: hypothetical protein QM778_24585 [Myxococcales bacterium]
MDAAIHDDSPEPLDASPGSDADLPRPSDAGEDAGDATTPVALGLSALADGVVNPGETLGPLPLTVSGGIHRTSP